MSYRDGFNLLNKYGRRNFFSRGILGDRWARRYVLKDTFGGYICAIFGHSKHRFKREDGSIICDRCYKEIKKS